MSEYPFNGAVDTEFTADGPLATEAKQAAGNISVAQIATLVAQAATEATLALMEAGAKRQAAMMPPRALQYARDVGDRMRVVVDQTSIMSVSGSYISHYWGALGAYPPWYGVGAPASMDAREAHQELTAQTFQQRRSRWVIT